MQTISPLPQLTPLLASTQHKKRGFSLIEVVLALGIISFAFLALFGMLPIGLNTFNNSIDSTISAQIAEGVMSQMREQRFSQLGAFNDTSVTTSGNLPSFFKSGTAKFNDPNPGFYFDDQGKPLGTQIPSTTPPANYIYSAGVQVYYDAQLPVSLQPSDGTIYSSAMNTTSQQPMATVVVTVRKISTPTKARIFTGYVANNGL